MVVVDSSKSLPVEAFLCFENTQVAWSLNWKTVEISVSTFTKPRRIVAFAALIFLAACNDETNDAVNSVKNLNTAIQSNQASLADVGHTASEVFTSIGDTTTNAIEPTKSALTSVGESVQKGVTVTGDTLTAIGNTVISLRKPDADSQ
jgi:hypothetical protein